MSQTPGARCVAMLLILQLALFALPLSTANAASDTPSSVYYNAVCSILNAQQADAKHITDVANQAADIYIQDGQLLGAAGEPMFVSEMSNRAGGMRQIQAFSSFFADPNWRGVVLYALANEDVIPAQVDISNMQKAGIKVVVFAMRSRLDELHANGVKGDWEIENHALPTDGVLQDSTGAWVVPTNGVANMMEGWQFTAEFVAALTRRGKMPTMWQSISVPGARDRDDKLAKVKFETYKRHPIPEGRLSADYADQLRGHLSKVFHSERNGIDALGRMMAQTITSGASIYYLSDGHADPHALGQENTPKIGIVEGNINPTHVHPQSGDVVLFLGYNARFGHPEWQRIATDAEGVGAKVVYSFAGYDKSEVSAIPSTVLYIDQHWVLGDAEVKIKDYDVNVFPVSGVIEDTILYMALADVIGLQVTNAAPLSAR